VKRVFAGLLAVALLGAACSNPPGPSGSAAPGNASGSSAPSVDIAKAAHDQLCNAQGGGSLVMVASQLDKLDANTDMSQLQATLGTLRLNIQQLQADPAAQSTRDAAGTALQRLQTSLNDPSTRQEAATAAATALRALQTAVCT
jgi:hypothetical protein